MDEKRVGEMETENREGSRLRESPSRGNAFFQGRRK